MLDEVFQVLQKQDDRLSNTALQRNYGTYKPARVTNPGNLRLASHEVTVTIAKKRINDAFTPKG